ncbi:hypothetical protein AVV29_gp156 [Vibrio phage phi 3]|uniref:Uncharacterized protein n=1 Tax=Vibrio phage phi 3 TaxID=1589298 RepID=A0A0B5H8U0_9CAUD|nr:hypothetical protein AVV29_gp156 [Vibrio phage phi 3]AJF40823.1 hypothetical protein SBVP3_0055 [Vibrio phage phi 3]
MINQNVLKALSGDVDAQQAYVQLCMLSTKENLGSESAQYKEMEEILANMRRAASRPYIVCVEVGGELHRLGGTFAYSLQSAAEKLLGTDPRFDAVAMTLNGNPVVEYAES